MELMKVHWAGCNLDFLMLNVFHKLNLYPTSRKKTNLESHNSTTIYRSKDSQNTKKTVKIPKGHISILCILSVDSPRKRFCH